MSILCFIAPRTCLLHATTVRAVKGRGARKSAQGASTAWCLGSLGTLRGWRDSILPWQVVTETTCPALSSQKYTVLMLKMCRDYVPVSQRLLFSVRWICILPWSDHKHPKQWIIFNLSWEIIPHVSLSWSISSYVPTLLLSLTSLCIAVLYRSKSFNFTLFFLLLTFLKREIYRQSSGEVAKHPTACPH